MEGWTVCRSSTQYWQINKTFYCTLLKCKWLQLYSLMDDLQGALLLALRVLGSRMGEDTSLATESSFW